jgi:hypothetical protein
LPVALTAAAPVSEKRSELSRVSRAEVERCRGAMSQCRVAEFAIILALLGLQIGWRIVHSGEKRSRKLYSYFLCTICGLKNSFRFIGVRDNCHHR